MLFNGEIGNCSRVESRELPWPIQLEEMSGNGTLGPADAWERPWTVGVAVASIITASCLLLALLALLFIECVAPRIRRKIATTPVASPMGSPSLLRSSLLRAPYDDQ